MKFAYFIMLHHKPYQFEWLLNAIYNPDDIFLIHIDLKTYSGLKRDRRGLVEQVKTLIQGKPNIKLMWPRYTNWGGWSLSSVALTAIDDLLQMDQTWTHFVNLSGQCYPLKPISEIKRIVASAPEAEFIESRPFSTLPDDDWHLRRQRMLETPVRAFILPGKRRPPSRFEMEYKGSQWVILTRQFCTWQQQAPIRRKIVSYLKGSLLSDELIFQSLFHNSPFRLKATADYGRRIIWPGPKTMDIGDLETLRQGAGLFGRKFDAAADADVLLELSASAGFRPGPLL